jgi:hypothetical protein
VTSFSGRRVRSVKYAAVGATFWLMPFTLLATLVYLGAGRPLADSVFFAISAQLGFLLSCRLPWGELPWGDRPAGGRQRLGVRRFVDNGTAVPSLAAVGGLRPRHGDQDQAYEGSYRLWKPAAAKR